MPEAMKSAPFESDDAEAENEKLKALLSELLTTIDLCLNSGCLPWDIEQKVEDVEMKARQVI